MPPLAGNGSDAGAPLDWKPPGRGCPLGGKRSGRGCPLDGKRGGRGFPLGGKRSGRGFPLVRKRSGRGLICRVATTASGETANIVALIQAHTEFVLPEAPGYASGTNTRAEAFAGVSAFSSEEHSFILIFHLESRIGICGPCATASTRCRSSFLVPPYSFGGAIVRELNANTEMVSASLTIAFLVAVIVSQTVGKFHFGKTQSMIIEEGLWFFGANFSAVDHVYGLDVVPTVPRFPRRHRRHPPEREDAMDAFPEVSTSDVIIDDGCLEMGA